MQDRLPDKRPITNVVQGSGLSSERKPFLSRKGLAIFGVAALVALLAAGYAYWQHAALYPSTDNAQVQANIIQIAPLVTGVISAVKVEEYATVKSGDVLVELDPAPFQAALKVAETRLTMAQQAAGAPGQPPTAKGNVEQAQAAVDQAHTDLDNATIKSPVDGTVGKVRVRPGTMARAGMGLFPIVDTPLVGGRQFQGNRSHSYQAGSKATMSIDIFPSREFSGEVVRSARPARSAFSLCLRRMPRGSWIKVVQRFPVRISLTFKPDDPADSASVLPRPLPSTPRLAERTVAPSDQVSDPAHAHS